jgi:hypothetical protein
MDSLHRFIDCVYLLPYYVLQMSSADKGTTRYLAKPAVMSSLVQTKSRCLIHDEAVLLPPRFLLSSLPPFLASSFPRFLLSSLPPFLASPFPHFLLSSLPQNARGQTGAMIQERAKTSGGPSPAYYLASHGSQGRSSGSRFEERGRGAKFGEGENKGKRNCEMRNGLRKMEAQL